MPEGDSLHRAAARLQPLVGDRVAATSPNPRALVTNVAKAIDGRVLESVEAVGKNLLLRFDGGVVIRSHLRMSGRWRVRPAGERPWRGLPWLVLRTDRWEATQWNGPVLRLDDGRVGSLGPDLLADATTVELVLQRLRAADQGSLVGEALLDQRLVAGIGNMWLAELLWHGRVSPWARLADVSAEALEESLNWGRRAMREAVRGARPSRAVYRRAGRACPRCGEPVRSRGLGDANRTAYWCPRCQPLAASS